MNTKAVLLTLAVIAGYCSIRGAWLHYNPTRAPQDLTEIWTVESNLAGEEAGLRWYQQHSSEWDLNKTDDAPKGWPRPEINGQRMSPRKLFRVLAELHRLEDLEQKGRWRPLISQIRASINRAVFDCPELDGPYKAWNQAASSLYQQSYSEWYTRQFFA